jgi:hypothetical protein
MEIPRVSKSVEKIVRLEKDKSGAVKPVVLYTKPRSKRKKGSPGVRGIEKAVWRLANAQRAYIDTYVGLHNNSNRKNKDGWLIDLGKNVTKAARRGRKNLRINRWIMM